MLLEAKSLTGRCHGNGMPITVSLWLCDFYVIMYLLRQLFWHSEKVTYQLFYWTCMILRENAKMFCHNCPSNTISLTVFVEYIIIEPRHVISNNVAFGRV